MTRTATASTTWPWARYGADPATGPSAGAGWIVRGVADPSALALDTGLVPANAADTTRTLVIGRRRARGSTVRPAASASAVPSPRSATSTATARADVAFGSDFAFRLGRSEAGEVAVALLPGPPRRPSRSRLRSRRRPDAVAPGRRSAPAPAEPVAKRNTALPTLTSRSLRVDSRGRVAFGVRCTRVAARCRGTLALRFGGRTVARALFATDGTQDRPGHAPAPAALPAPCCTRRRCSA